MNRIYLRHAVTCALGAAAHFAAGREDVAEEELADVIRAAGHAIGLDVLAVQRAIDSKASKRNDDFASAEAAGRFRQDQSLILGKGVADLVDGKLYELELAYYRQASALAEKRAPKGKRK